METTLSQTVGGTVAKDYRAAAVFQKHGIDFCCHGGQTIDQACEKKGIDRKKLLDEIAGALSESSDKAKDYNSWSLTDLAGHIKTRHHRYITEQTPVILQFLDKLCKVHGQRHPELFEIQSEFQHMADELADHMQKEELILFPAIQNLEAADKNGSAYSRPAFGNVQNPINMMMHEHAVEGGRLERINSLTGGYNPPPDGCTTYRVTFQMLQHFEDDLHLHIHLENNILFPRAVKLEASLS